MEGEAIHLPDCTIAEIALDFPHAIRVLNRYQLDFCCRGKDKLEDACHQRMLDPEQIWNEILQELPLPRIGNHHFKNWETCTLIDFIIQNHHEYAKLIIPQITDLLARITLNHAVDTPELRDIQKYFHMLADELLDHMPKEEEILFPAIRRLATHPVSATLSPLLANIQGPLDVMEMEHTNFTNFLRLLRTLTDGYRVRSASCPTFQLLYKLLEEFDADLVQHMHIENNVLFSKVRL